MPRPYLLIATLLLASCISRHDSLSEWPQIRSELSIPYRTTIHDDLTLTFGRRTINTITEIHTEETRSITQIFPNGSFDLEINTTRVCGSITGSRYKNTVTFDTAKSNSMHPTAKNYAQLMDRTAVVSVDPDFKVLSVRFREEDGELGEPDDHATELRQLEFIRPPTLPMAIDSTWRAPEGIHECTQNGCIELKTRNTLIGIDAKSLTIATTALPDHAKDIEPLQKVSRTLQISRQDGMILSMQVSGSNHEKLAKREIRMETERLSDLSVKD